MVCINWNKFIWHEIWTLGTPDQFCVKLLPALDFVKYRRKKTTNLTNISQMSSFMATLMWVTVPGRSTHRGPWGGTTGRSCGRRAQWMLTRPLQRCGVKTAVPILLGFPPFPSWMVMRVIPLCPTHHQVIPQGQSNGASWPYTEPSKTINRNRPHSFIN